MHTMLIESITVGDISLYFTAYGVSSCAGSLAMNCAAPLDFLNVIES